LIPAGFLLLAKNSPLPTDDVLRAVGALGWIAVSAFLPLLLAFAQSKVLPLLLELILLGLFVILLGRLHRNARSSAPL
jgi:hypothetical protein